jgi:hypothetical protein
MIKSFTICIGILFFILLINDANAQTKSIKKSTSRNVKQKKELVYLYTGNGGLVGYFSDGSVVGCPKCDFCKSSILAMFKEKPRSGKWNLKKPDDFVFYEEDKGWVLVNYKWKEKVPQY